MAIISTDLVTLDPFGPEQQAFVAHMRRQERSEKTVDAYVWALKHFRRFMRHQSIERFDQISRELLEEWPDHLATTPNPATGKPLSARSRSLAQTAIRMFFLWAAQREKCDAKLALWFTKIKVPDLKPKPLETDTMIRVRHFFLEQDGSPQYLRDRALFFYGIGVGGRVAELLRVPRIGWERVEVIQKGGSTKVMTCPEFAAEHIRAYLHCRVDACPALWVSHPGTPDAAPMTPAAVRGIWRSIAKRLGVKRFTTHQLRHTAATAMLAAGEDPMTVSTFLGHKNLTTLKVYARVPEATRARATATMNRFLEAG